jgi:hypothetical protein
LAHLHFRPSRETPSHDRHSFGIDVRHNEPVEAAQLLGELAETGTNLQHRPATVLDDQTVLESPVAGFVRTRFLPRDATRCLTKRAYTVNCVSGHAHRPSVIGDWQLPARFE